MADKNSKKRQLKRVETVRERSQKAPSIKKPRRLHRTAKTAGKPIVFVGSLIKTVLRPFSFLLAPFRTRPLLAIGRFLAKVLGLSYMRDSWRELKNVTWPTGKETWKLSLAVFTFALIFGSIIALTDFVLDKVFRQLLLG